MNLKSFFSLPRRPRGCGGFTLMELLFVLLVIALVLSFALPAYRSVRYDMRNSSAKAALRKLAEARRSFYQYSKGADVTGEIDTDLVRQYAGQGCVSGAASGVPAGARDSSEVGQLFACKFLDWKDFAKLPYVFTICDGSTIAAGSVCALLGTGIYAVAAPTTAAGHKYTHQKNGTLYYMYIGQDMLVKDTLE